MGASWAGQRGSNEKDHYDQEGITQRSCRQLLFGLRLSKEVGQGGSSGVRLIMMTLLDAYGENAFYSCSIDVVFQCL